MVLLRECENKDWGVCVTPDAVTDNAHSVWPCTKLPRWLPVPSKHFAFPEEIFRNIIYQEVGWLWARLFGMCFLVCGETQMHCIQFLLTLRGKYQSEWPFTWQETQDVGQHLVKYFFYKGKFHHSEHHGFVLFLHGFLTGIWALPLWWACLEQVLKWSGFSVEFCCKEKKK